MNSILSLTVRGTSLCALVALVAVGARQLFLRLTESGNIESEDLSPQTIGEPCRWMSEQSDLPRMSGTCKLTHCAELYRHWLGLRRS